MPVHARLGLLALLTLACEGPEVPLGALPPPGTEDGASARCPDPLPGTWLFCEDFETLPDPAARFFEYDVEPGVDVVDTVGAGDAFVSVLILGELEGWSPDESLRRAQEFAGGVIGLRGATTADRAFYADYARAWGLER